MSTASEHPAHAELGGREREPLYRSLFEQASVGMAQMDAAGRFRHVNRRLCEMLDYSPAELCGLTYRDITHPDHAGTDIELHRRLLADPSAEVAFEKRVLRRDGTIIWVHVDLRRLGDVEPASFVAVMLDITAQRDPGSLERTPPSGVDASQQRKNLHSLHVQTSAFQAAANGIVITDRDGTIESVNPAFSTLTGYAEGELLGRNMRVLSSKLQPPEFYKAMWATILEGRVWHGELVNRRKDGRVYDEEMTITPVRDETGEISHFVAIKQDVSERKRADATLLASEARYRALVDNLDDVVFSVDDSGRFTFVNHAIHTFGYDALELLGKPLDALVHEADRARMHALLDGLVSAAPSELRLIDANGKTRVVRASALSRESLPGEAWRAGVLVDLTSRRETEEQLRAAQKMEAVGRLAGGVAHDFNNLLSVILSYTELALDELRPEDPLHTDLSEVVQAATRAEGLTRQLLAFSRRQVMSPEPLDVSALILGMAKMLGRLIGEDIDLCFVLAQDLNSILADRGQLEQVVMNLVVNARDAMPRGGHLRIETSNVELSETCGRALDLTPGPYVCVSVSDDGVGMSEEVTRRIFEPFFTTKGLGKGTGLGLSMVYGILRQSGGAIAVESTPGVGTTFRAYLPRKDRPAAGPSVRPSLRPASTGHERVLVVEDEPALRAVITRVLSSSGYEVVAAANGGEALLYCERSGADVRLLLTDVVMPVMNGAELWLRVAPFCPQAKVLFMSGYTDDAIERHGVLSRELLRKPFDWRTLARRVRAAIDGVDPSPSSSR